MSGDKGDKETQLTPVAVQEMVEMVSKVIESAMSSFSGRIMKAVDDKLSEARTANPDADASKSNGKKTPRSHPAVVRVCYLKLM